MCPNTNDRLMAASLLSSSQILLNLLPFLKLGQTTEVIVPQIFLGCRAVLEVKVNSVYRFKVNYEVTLNCEDLTDCEKLNKDKNAEITK